MTNRVRNTMDRRSGHKDRTFLEILSGGPLISGILTWLRKSWWVSNRSFLIFQLVVPALVAMAQITVLHFLVHAAYPGPGAATVVVITFAILFVVAFRIIITLPLSGDRVCPRCHMEQVPVRRLNTDLCTGNLRNASPLYLGCEFCGLPIGMRKTPPPLCVGVLMSLVGIDLYALDSAEAVRRFRDQFEVGPEECKILQLHSSNGEKALVFLGGRDQRLEEHALWMKGVDW